MSAEKKDISANDATRREKRFEFLLKQTEMFSCFLRNIGTKEHGELKNDSHLSQSISPLNDSNE